MWGRTSTRPGLGETVSDVGPGTGVLGVEDTGDSEPPGVTGVGWAPPASIAVDKTTAATRMFRSTRRRPIRFPSWPRPGRRSSARRAPATDGPSVLRRPLAPRTGSAGPHRLGPARRATPRAR